LILHDKIKTDSTRFNAVTHWPAPAIVLELQCFIAFAIKLFSATTQPLHNSTEHDTAFHWEKSYHQAYKEMKTTVASAPVFKVVNPFKAFILGFDCSDKPHTEGSQHCAMSQQTKCNVTTK
jgi:hypothetical protein